MSTPSSPRSLFNDTSTTKNNKVAPASLPKPPSPKNVRTINVGAKDSSSTSPSSKREPSPTAKQKLGWTRIQRKTETIVSQIKQEKKTEKGKRKTVFESFDMIKKIDPNRDRNHAITEQIDAIRAEQIQRARLKKEHRKIRLTEKHKVISWNCIKTFNIRPRSTWKQIWDIAILLLVVFSSVQIPLLLAFPDMTPLDQALQITLDAIFIVDFGFCFRTGFIRPDNEVELDQGKILSHYLKTWFAIDLAACFPLDYFFPETEGDTSSSAKYKQALRLLKLPRLLRLGRLLKFLARFKYAGAMKIVKFILMLILVAHWVGCGFFFIIGLEDEYGYNTWMEHNVGLTVAGDDIPSRYLTMLYTSFLMLIGEGMDMETDVEKAYGAFVVLVGTIVTAVIVGNVSFVVSNQNSTAFQYQSKIDMISDEMRALHLPGELQTRTLQYYDYLWNRHRTFDPNCTRFTADLSPTLRKEILLHMNRECVLNCDFFRDVSNECIIRLVHSFKFAVFLNSDVVAEEGELAAELVFVIHGSAKVMKKGRVMPVSLLSPGDYFGEKSLLMHHRNAVSVVAIENCDTRVLEKMDFEDLCIDFPELRESILKRSDHMDVTEYDRHKKRRTSLRVASTNDMLDLEKLQNLDLSISLEEVDSSTKVTTPKGGVFSFEPPATGSGGGKHVDVDSSGGSGRSFATGAKARISHVLSIVEVLNDRVTDMDEKQNTINAKLDLLLQRMVNAS